MLKNLLGSMDTRMADCSKAKGGETAYSQFCTRLDMDLAAPQSVAKVHVHQEVPLISPLSD
jgi:hypothetical protein